MWEYKYPITSDELYHHGTKKMKWGQRLYQYKDGSLTPLGKLRYGKKSKSEKREESVEERRSRILKSTDPKELYKNRDLLTTNEIKERLERIDTERRLANVAESTKKTGFDRVDKVLKIGKKINEIYEFTNTPVMKALKKKMGVESEPKHMSLKEVYDKRNSLSDKALNDALNRSNTEKAIKKILDEMESEVDKKRKTSETDASQKNNNSEKSKEKTKDDNSKKSKEKTKDDNTKKTEEKKKR